MYNFIDIFCGIGSMTKAFERTGAFKCVGGIDFDRNMLSLYKHLFFYTPIVEGDILKNDGVRRFILSAEHDVIVAGMADLNEEVFFKVLDILSEDLPKAFVFELSTAPIHKSLCKTLKNFCEKNDYIFVGFDDGIDNITLNLFDFGVPEQCERIYCVCIRKDCCHCDDDLFLQLRKEHDFECYKYDGYNPDENIKQRRGLDWGFSGKIGFLIGTPEKEKENIVESSSPLPVVASVALDLMTWLK